MSDQKGMRGKLQAILPSLNWGWCYPHRLELACKDAFSSRLFHDIDEMLLRLYYLYESHLGSAVNFQTLLMISRCSNSLKGGNLHMYQCKLMEVVGLHTSGKFYSELSIHTVLT